MASASLMLSSSSSLSLTHARKGDERLQLAFRAGIPLGALVLGKLIPLLGISVAVAGFGLCLVGVASYFLIVMTKLPTFQRKA